MSSHVNGLQLWFTRQTQWELEGNHILMKIASSFFLPVRIPPIHHSWTRPLSLPSPLTLFRHSDLTGLCLSTGFRDKVLIRSPSEASHGGSTPRGRGGGGTARGQDRWAFCSQGLQASDFCSLSLCHQIVVTVGLSFTALSSLSLPPPREKRRKQSFTFWFTKCTFSVFCL